MRTYAQPIPSIDLPADTVGAAIIATTGANVSADWPSGAKVARFAGTGGFYLNPWSTGAVIPTTFSGGSTVSTGRTFFNPLEQPRTLQIPGDSTGYSLTAAVAGTIITSEFWNK